MLTAPPLIMTNGVSSDTTVETFKAEQQNGFIESTGSTPTEPDTTTVPAADKYPTPPPAAPTYVPTLKNPAFEDSEDEEYVYGADTAAPAEPEQPKRSEDYRATVLMGLVNSEDYLSCELAALISGGNPETYKSSDRDKEQLVLLMEPFQEWIIDKCPAALPFCIVYGSVKLKQARLAMRDRQTIEDNKKKKKSLATANAIATEAIKPKERTYFKIQADGYYRDAPTGGYIKRTDTALLEKPNLKDIEKIMEVNDLPIVLKCFDIDKAEFMEMLNSRNISLPQNYA